MEDRIPKSNVHTNELLSVTMLNAIGPQEFYVIKVGIYVLFLIETYNVAYIRVFIWNDFIQHSNKFRFQETNQYSNMSLSVYIISQHTIY